MLRDVIARSAAQGNYRLASVVAGDLCNLLRSSGRLEEALKVAGEKAGYTRQAGLGPWTQLVDEGQRLQVLAAMGRYDEVLAEVESLRPKMDALPLESEAEEAANPWNVRETLLDTGRKAALRSERWETALALNAEVVKATQARGADALEVARTRFNDYGPLLRLGRYDDARALLLSCRAVFEAERDIGMLGKVYSALADLEDETGGRAAAVRFEEVALGYTYQAGEPEDCAISHHNLANYLERQGADPATVLAHRLAAAAICLQMQSGLLSTALRNLANSACPPPRPPSPMWSGAWRPSRACASRRCSSACPAPPPTATPPSPPSGRWWRTRRDAGTKRGRDKTRCWPRPPRPSGRRSSGRATSSTPPYARRWRRCPRRKPPPWSSACGKPV